MTTPIRTVGVSKDEEHNTYSLDVEDRSHGYSRVFHFGIEFVSSGEYRTLAAAYREIQDVRFPVVVRVADGPRDHPVAVRARAMRTAHTGRCWSRA